MGFLNLFTWHTLGAIVALVLFSRNSGESAKHAAKALLGLAVGIGVILARLVLTHPFPVALTGVLFDFGVALLAVTLYLKRQGLPRKAHLILGLMFLALSWVGLGVIELVDAFLSTDSPPTATVATDHFLLELGEDDTIEELGYILDRFEARAEKAFPKLTLEEDADLAQVYIIYADRNLGQLMAALARDTENVDEVAEDLLLAHLPPPDGQPYDAQSANFLANDPLINQQWWLGAIGTDDVHLAIQDITPERKAIIGVLDSGVDGSHEDMSPVFGPSPGDKDGNGHGTHCAGVAGAPANNGVGIGSLNWEGRFVEIRGYAVLDRQGMGSSEKLAQGVLDATRDGVDVISLSLGAWSPLPPKVLTDAVAFALDRGVVVVAAAGNSSADAADHTPSNIEGVISVAAVDDRLNRASFSNTNASLARPLSAPGVGILSLMPSNAYKSLNGTSMATPVVSGIAGLLRSLEPELTADEIYTILSETAKRSNSGDRIGPIVNARDAVNRVLETH